MIFCTENKELFIKKEDKTPIVISPMVKKKKSEICFRTMYTIQFQSYCYGVAHLYNSMLNCFLPVHSLANKSVNLIVYMLP